MSAPTVLDRPRAQDAPVDEDRLEAICAQLAELCGQQNAIAGRITELLAEVDECDARLLGGTGLRSLEHFCTWQLGVSPARARNLTTIARRADDLPRTTALLRDGALSEDQAAVIARRAPTGTDHHYADLATTATVSQLRRALRVAPSPADDASDSQPGTSPSDRPESEVSAHWDDDDDWVCRVRLSKLEGSVADAALRSHLDALVNDWRRTRESADDDADLAPFPTLADAFVRMCAHSLDAEAHVRPHGHRTTIVMHLDVERRLAQLHVGPALSAAERRELTCDAKVEAWFERDGVPIGVGRSTRQISRRLRRALEHRARGGCEVPGCDTTTGLHAHHLWHWEDGGPTELWNLALVCGHHHRLHHRGLITIRGPAHRLSVLDRRRRPFRAGALAHPPAGPPPERPPYRHPTGERFDHRWYEPPSLT